MKARRSDLDVFKGILIILMVLGHVIQTIISPDDFDNNIVFKVIYSFHMPAFFFISGYLDGGASKALHLAGLEEKHGACFCLFAAGC